MSMRVIDECPRLDPPSVADEKTMTSAFLDFQRETLLCKAGGLAEAEGWRQLPPSALSLLGLLKHCALVEQIWFRERFASVPGGAPPRPFGWDEAFAPAPSETPAGIVARYRAEIANSQAITAAHDFDDLASNPPDYWEGGLSLRWIMLHMIEETARHVGHADLLREAIDGEIGE